MGWTFPWASSLGGDFNFDFNVSVTERQQREGGVEYNYERSGHALDAKPETAAEGPVAEIAAMTGTDAAAFMCERPGMSAFVLEVGVVVLIAGSLQLTAWKARRLACYREAPGRGRTLPADAGTAWRHGLRLGLHCTHCCVGLMAILLVIGVMDLRAMAVVAAAITVERLAQACARAARAIGAVVFGAGSFLIALAVSPLAGRFQSPPNTFRHSASVAAISSFTSAGGTRAYFAPFSLRPCCSRLNSR